MATIHKQRRRFLLFKLLFVILLVSIFNVNLYDHNSYADMGPKPSLKIIIENPPSEEYYLDLLVEGDMSHKNIGPDELIYLNTDMVDILESYNDDNWHLALIHGTNIPMYGELIGESQGNTMVHHFGYLGLPTKYKVAIVTTDLKLYTSEIIYRKIFTDVIHIDFRDVSEAMPGNEFNLKSRASIFIGLLKQFMMTFTMTVLIEGIIFYLFKYRSKHSYFVFLNVNFTTQLLFTLVLGSTLIIGGSFMAILFILPLEALILAAEIMLYKRFLKEQDTITSTLYAVIANILSFVAGAYWIFYNA